MEGWEEARLGNICELQKQRHEGNDLPYIGMEHIESGTGRLSSELTVAEVKSSTFRFNQTHLLYGRLRPYLNKVFLPDFDGHCSTEIFPILCSDKLDRSFLFYWLTTEAIVEKINRTSTGTRMPRANVKAVLDFDFPLPPLPEQERIVAILDEAFTAIETATAHTEKNLANARELESQVLDLVVTGALSSNFTTETSAKELLNDVERTVDEAVQRKTYRRPRVSSDSQIPVPTFRIPLNWEWAELHSLTVGISDGVHKKPTYVDRGVPFIAIENLTRGPGISFEPVRHITMSDHEEYIKRTHPERGDILITKDGTIGVVRLIETDIEFSIFVSVALVKPASKTMSEYLSLALKAPKIQNQIIPKGAALKHLYLRDLRQLWIPVPPVEEQDHIVGKHRPLNQYIKDLSALSEKRLVALSNLKQSLLHKAFTGELTSDNITADRTLSEAGL
jgi:type I restriction enzyme, S subunit